VKKSSLVEHYHTVPAVLFLALAGIFSTSDTSVVFEPPFLLPVLNTTLLAVLPFIIASLAANSYARQGSRAFILFGCGMVAFGMGSLLSGWGLIRYGPNFYVTVHNVGSLLGGLCQLGGVALLLHGPSAKAQSSRRNSALVCVISLLTAALLVLAISLLAARGSFPIFFEPERGPTLIRQVVLTVAVIGYALSAVLLVAVYAQTRMIFLSLYSSGLFLTAIGLGILLIQRNIGTLLGWTGRASQYFGSAYFVVAMLVGIRETRLRGTSLPAYLSELFRSHVDDQVQLRTRGLEELNRRLQDEVTQRLYVEGELRHSRDELRHSRDELRSVYDSSPVMMCVLDADFRVLYANPVFSELVGVPEGRLIGGLAPAVFGCADAAVSDPQCGFGLRCGECRIRRAMEDTLTTGRAHYEVEYRAALERQGAQREAWFLSSTVRIAGHSGPRLLLTLLDITDRKRAEQELKENESLYRTFIEDSLQGFAIIQDGQIVLCNDALCRLSGYTKKQSYDLSPEEVMATVHPEDRNRVGEAMRQIVDEGRVLPAQVIRLLNRDGDSFWVEVLCARTTFHGRSALQLSYVNRTEEIRAETAYHSIIDHAMNGMAILQNGRIIFANQGLADICGYTVAELLRMTADQINDVIHKEDRGKVLVHMSDRLAGREAPTVQKFRFIHKDGSVRWVETQSVRVEHEGGPAIQVSYRDATMEKAAEEQLERTHQEVRNLAVHLLHVREEERRKVAQEIHDQLGQTLAALKMDLHWLLKRLGGDVATLRDKVKGTIELGEQAIFTVQRIASDLRPRMLDDLGLAPALDWLSADFVRRTKIACTVRTNLPSGVVGGNAATGLYRIVQEALANVARHSRADHAAVRLFITEGALILQIEDDGIGITAEQAAAPDSYGLIGMRERAEGLRGSLSISGESGFGTILLARIPIPEAGGLR
jgi:PAS domain S-box-containing protein